MASIEDPNFNTALFRGRSMAQMSLGRILGTVSSAAEPLSSQPSRRKDEGLEGESLVGRNVEKRGFWNIDLNVAPPEDADSEFTEAEDGGNGREISPPANVASDVSGRVVGLCDGCELDFDGIGKEVGVEIETKIRKISRVDAEFGTEDEKYSRNRRWISLLEVAENALPEKEEVAFRNRKRGASHEAGVGGEPHKGITTRLKISGQRRQSLVADINDDNLAAVAVVRSSRGRAVAMPNKYRDSVLDTVAVGDLTRRNKSGKSVARFSANRKSR